MADRFEGAAAVDHPDDSSAISRDTLVDEPIRSDIRQICPVAPRDPRIGTLVCSRYLVQKRLGSGGAGIVYRALDEVADQPVALKLMHSRLRTDDQHVARFAREVRALSKVAHSAVVRVLDAGQDRDRTPFLVMELLEGEVLTDEIERGLETRDVIEVGRQLLGALAAAHAAGIIHRDIKPENLFLARSPSGALRLKVLDFGIAKLVAPDAVVSFQTLDGLILGTPEYMSPEVCKGHAVTAHADLWAAAAVLFHALTGRPPFDEEQVGMLLLRIVREPAPSLAALRPDLPAAITAAIDRALLPDPAARWSDAGAFATALGASAPIVDLDWE